MHCWCASAARDRDVEPGLNHTFIRLNATLPTAITAARNATTMASDAEFLAKEDRPFTISDRSDAAELVAKPAAYLVVALYCIDRSPIRPPPMIRASVVPCSA
jgi:hypothetical protein